MPRFYFDFHDGDHRPIDAEGLDLPDAHVAKQEAVVALKQLLFSGPGHDDARVIACHVRNEAGRVIYLAEARLGGAWVERNAARSIRTHEDPRTNC